MKRISDFEDCRMDMKNMAALNGGASCTTSKEDTYFNGTCDIGTTSNYDESFRINGVIVYHEWSTYDIKRVDCPPLSIKYLDIASVMPSGNMTTFNPVAGPTTISI